jgi:hypothetical protein
MNQNWVSPETIKLENISVDERQIPKTTRSNILYKYETGEIKPLYFTTPLIEQTFLAIGAPTKRPFKDSTGTMVTPTKHSCSIMMDGNNEHHVLFHEALGKISERVSSLCGKPCNIPIIYHENNCFLFANLIENKDNQVYTRFYNEQKVYSIQDCPRFLGRPCIGFSVNNKNGKISAQMTDAYVYKPLDNYRLANIA